MEGAVLLQYPRNGKKKCTFLHHFHLPLSSAVLCAYLGQKTECDVRLRCSDGWVPCHQMVLASISPLLRSVLSADTGEDIVTIMMPDLTVLEVDTFLGHIYEGSFADASTSSDIFKLFGANISRSEINTSPLPLIDVGASSKGSLKTEQPPSAPDDDSNHIQKMLMTLEPQNNVRKEQEEKGHDSDSTLSADPLDTDSLKEDFDETPDADTDRNKAKALELVEIKIKVENQEEQSSTSVTEEQPQAQANVADSEENIKPKKKRTRGPHKRTAVDPIWAHVSNKDCAPNAYSRGSVTCNYCEKTFALGYAVQHIWGVHKIMVERPRRYKEGRPQDVKTAAHWAHFSEDPENRFRCICQVCGKNLSRISASKHLRQKHDIGEKFLCSFCGKAFRDNNTKNTHELIHTKSYQYFCSLCGKGFYQNHQLNYHMLKVHDDSDEKPFQCSECGKSYKLNIDLSVHIHQHHRRKTTKGGNPQKGYTQEEIAKKPHQCEICNKRFAKEDYFNLHMKIHTGEAKIECPICQKTFTDAYYLKYHMRTIHSDARPFNCNICKKDFKHKLALQRHMVVHTKEKPYTCERCNKSFGWQSVLRNHKCSVEEEGEKLLELF